MRIGDWSSDVCSSDLQLEVAGNRPQPRRNEAAADDTDDGQHQRDDQRASAGHRRPEGDALDDPIEVRSHGWSRSEEHTSELQSLMRISYAVFCLKKKKKTKQHIRSVNQAQHRVELRH